MPLGLCQGSSLLEGGAGWGGGGGWGSKWQGTELGLRVAGECQRSGVQEERRRGEVVCGCVCVCGGGGAETITLLPTHHVASWGHSTQQEDVEHSLKDESSGLMRTLVNVLYKQDGDESKGNTDIRCPSLRARERTSLERWTPLVSEILLCEVWWWHTLFRSRRRLCCHPGPFVCLFVSRITQILLDKTWRKDGTWTKKEPSEFWWGSAQTGGSINVSSVSLTLC